MIAKIKRFLKSEDGPTAAEYAVMVALITGAVLASVSALSIQTAASFDDSAAQIASAIGS